jgi:diphthamide synthase (EF-2-diphthine--ammonia ligase)
MSTTTQYPDSISLSGNLKKFIVSSSAEITFLLEQGATTILDEKYQPDADSLITIDVRTVIERLLEIVIPADSTTITEQTTGVGDFSATIDGGSAITFRVIKGGVAELEVTPSAWLDSHFLTWQPQEKSIVQQAPEWIGIYPISSGAIKCTGYFADGTSETVTYASLDAGKLYSINTSWGNVDGAMAKVPIAWDVAFFVGATQQTPIQRYILRNSTDEEHGFVWVNTLGGIDSASFTGAQEEDEKLEHKDVEYYDESISEYDIDKMREIRQSTGFITADEGLWLKDFFYSRKKYLIRADGSFKPIAVVESKILSNSQDDQYAYEFTYRLGVDEQLLNLDRTITTLPAPEGLADFFLTDLLSSLTEASYADSLIMAVQSPYAIGWQKLSLAQLVIASGGGSVKSVALELPAEFKVAGSPVTTTGSLLATWKDQLINLIFASPASGLAGAPSFRALVPADIPGLDWSKLTSGVPAFLTAITKAMIEAQLTGAITSHTHSYLAEITSLMITTALGFTPESIANKTTDTALGASDTLYPSQKAVKSYVDSMVSGMLDYRGGFDASGIAFPSSGGSGPTGTILKGDMWIVSVAGTMGGVAVQVGDSVIANTDTPGQSAVNWNMLNANISYVPEDAANKSTDTALGSSDTLYPTQKAVKAYADTKQPGSLELTAIASISGTAGLLKKTGAGTWILDTSYLTGITKAMVEAVLTGAITSHTHAYQPSDADLTAIAALAGTSGILKKTAADTWTLDTSAYLTAITKAMIEAQLTGAITSHTHAAYLTSITKAMVEAVLTGAITSHTHAAYLTSITKAMVEAVLTGAITSHTHAAYLTSITKAMVEAVLTGAITSHTHAYVAGTGTENYFPVWLTGGATIGASLIFYEGPDVVQINTNNSLGNLRIGQKDASQVAAVDYTAYGNTLFGSKVSPLITSGYYNTVTGNNAGYSITVGFKNAIYAAFAASYLTTGDRNIIIGYLAGRNPDNDIAQYRIIGEDDMVLIGHGATKNNAGTIVNGIAIGSGAMVLLSNQAVLGNDSITSTILKGTVTIPALKVTSAGYGVGKVLVSDANGLLSYANSVVIDDISFEFRDITPGAAQSYTLDISASYGYTIESATLETDSGTLTGVAVKIGSTAVTSLSNLTASTLATTDSTGAKTVVATNRVTINTSTGFTGAPTTLRGKLKIQRT